MFLKKLVGHGDLEKSVIQGMDRHVQYLSAGCDAFLEAIEGKNPQGMLQVREIEREADVLRRDMIHMIYQGAFLPYLRPELSRYVEIVDHIFDSLERAADCFREIRLPESLRKDASRVALLNRQMCDMLGVILQAMVAGEELKEKLLAIRIYEKRIDDMEAWLMKDARSIPVQDFWEGHLLTGFLSSLCSVSDRIEDASDHLGILGSIFR